MSKGQYKKSQVLMKTSGGYEHMFESITEAAKFAHANAWTMSLKMEVFGYFEDKQGNKYYRQDKMKTKNEYIQASPKIVKEMTKKTKRKGKREGRQIKVVVDGIVYNSIREAEMAIKDFRPNTLSGALKNGQKMMKGHKIAYFNEESITDINNMPKIVDFKPKKEEKTTITIDSDDPAIKAINDKIVDILKKAGVYDEIQKLSKAIQKLSK